MSSERDFIHVVYRYGPPSKFHCEPYSTQWRVRESDDTETCYIQTSKDEANPVWVRYGDLLEEILYPKLDDEIFYDELMQDHTILQSFHKKSNLKSSTISGSPS